MRLRARLQLRLQLRLWGWRVKRLGQRVWEGLRLGLYARVCGGTISPSQMNDYMEVGDRGSVTVTVTVTVMRVERLEVRAKGMVRVKVRAVYA